jgi:hypothetical protein
MAKDLHDYCRAIDEFYGQYNEWLKCVQGDWVLDERDLGLRLVHRSFGTGTIMLTQLNDTITCTRMPSLGKDLTNQTIEEVVATLESVYNPKLLRRHYLKARLVSFWTRDVKKIHDNYTWVSDPDNWRRLFVANFLVHIPFLYFKTPDQIRKVLRIMYGKYYLLEVLQHGGFYGTVKYGKEVYRFDTGGYKIEFVPGVWGSFSIMVDSPTERFAHVEKNLTYWQLYKIIRQIQKDTSQN